VKVRRTVGVVAADDVEFLLFDFYQGGVDASGGVCGGSENAMGEGGDWSVEQVV